MQDKLKAAQAHLQQLTRQHEQQQTSAYSAARISTSPGVTPCDISFLPTAASKSLSSRTEPGQVRLLLPPTYTCQPAGGTAKAPPVEQLDPYRLLPGRDPELGFGQQDLVAAVSDFATHVRRTVRPEFVFYNLEMVR